MERIDTAQDILGTDLLNNSNGCAYDGTRNYGQAISDYSRAIEIDPEHINARYYRGVIYGYCEYFDKALVDFSKVIEVDTGYANVYFYRGMVYYYLEDTEKADADYERAVQLAGFRPGE